MSMDVIADFLTIIRNGLMVGKRFVSVSSSRMKVDMASVLKDEGYIKDYKIEKNQDMAGEALVIFLKYVNGNPVVHELVRVSKPSRRIYEKLKNVTPVIGGLGISILSTNKGIMTDHKARGLGIGGEVLCHIW